MNNFKKLLCFLIAALVILSPSVVCHKADGSSGYPIVNLSVETYPVNLNDKCLLINGTAMFPVRELCSYANISVTWDDETHCANAKAEGVDMTFAENSDIVIFNGMELKLPVPAVTVNSKLYAPLRAIFEGMGCEVNYVEKTNTVCVFFGKREVLTAPVISVTSQVLTPDDAKWLEETLTYSTGKVAHTVGRIKGNVTYSSQNGFYTGVGAEKNNWWTNGFYPGILWIMYENTGDQRYADYAASVEEKLTQGLEEKETLDHDMGFLWMLSGWRNYSLTQNEISKSKVIKAAEVLYSRYNRDAKFIVAWNGKGNENKSIIDTMMNLDLLYTATNITRNPVYAKAASNHADTTIKNFVREDGSCHHQVIMDPVTGERTGFLAGQGYDDGTGTGSHWARGTAWALNGFTKCYGYTGDIRYLETAKKIAAYFESGLRNGYDVPMDFNQPSYSKLTDTSAAAIAASGLIDLAKHTNDEKYLTLAINILKNLTASYGGDNGDEALLTNGCVTYSNPVQQTLIYGDYYYLEALMKLKDFAY